MYLWSNPMQCNAIPSNPIKSNAIAIAIQSNSYSNSNSNVITTQHKSDSIEAYGIFDSIRVIIIRSLNAALYCLGFLCCFFFPKDIIVHDPCPWGLFHWIWGLYLFLHIHIHMYSPKMKRSFFFVVVEWMNEWRVWRGSIYTRNIIIMYILYVYTK